MRWNMCIKTGDEVLVCDNDGEVVVKVYLYTRKDGRHMCQRRENWELNANAMMPYEEIKPAPKYETRVLGPVAMMQRLVDEGFTCDRSGDWNNPDETYIFDATMFSYCGKPKGKDSWVWLDWMLEKVEIKP